MVETSDDELRGSIAQVQLEIVKTELAQSSGTLSVVINFKNQVLFDMATFSVDTLTCSPLDASWFMSLPDVIEPDVQIVGM